MNVIKNIFSSGGNKCKVSGDEHPHHHGQNKEKIVRSHSRKNAAAAPSPPEINVKMCVDTFGSFLSVENPSAARNRRSCSDVSDLSPNLARRTKADRFIQMNVDVDLDLNCDSQGENKQQFLRAKKQIKRSNSATTEKEIMRNMNRFSYKWCNDVQRVYDNKDTHWIDWYIHTSQ